MKTNESHGNKKHNGPKSELAAMRKGNRDAEMEKLGGGFRQTKKIHKLKTEKPSKKVDLDRIGDEELEETRLISYGDLMTIISESISNEIGSMLNEDLREDMECNSWIAEDDNEDFLDYEDGQDEEDELRTGYFIDLVYYDTVDDDLHGDMGYSFNDMWDGKCETAEDAFDSIKCGFNDEDYKRESIKTFRNEHLIPVNTIVRAENGNIVEELKSYIPKYFSRFASLIRSHLETELEVI